MNTHPPGVLLRAAASVLVLGLLAVGVPWLLVATVGNPLTDSAWSWDQPLTSDALLAVIAVLGWLIWAQMMLCLLVEVGAEIRLATGRTADWMVRVPGTLTGQQHLARVLVQAVVAVGLGGSALSQSSQPGTPALADAAGVHVEPTAAGDASAALGNRDPRADHAEQPQSEPSSHRVELLHVEVVQGDTLWSLAEEHLGSGERWRDIAELNHGRQMANGSRFEDASSIRPGWDLLIPASHPTTQQDAPDLTVQPRDTLWGLAERAYGDGARWTRLYRANRDQIADPDLIHPGQVLEVPPPAARSPQRHPTTPSPRSAPDDHDQADTWRPPRTGAQPPELPPIPSSNAPQNLAKDGERALVDDTVSDTTEPQLPGTLVAALLGGGSLLAACLLVSLRTRRRRRQRDRRSGHTPAQTPEGLISTDRTLRSIGSANLASTRLLDAALRDLARSQATRGEELPEVAAVRLHRHRIELFFARPPASSPPQPWTHGSDGQSWRRPVEAVTAPHSQPAPYPALVAMGQDSTGSTWLLDLEATKLLQLRGDRKTGEQMARFIAAELSVNIWSDDVTISISRLAPNLSAFHRGRVRHEPAIDFESLIKAKRRMKEACESAGLAILDGRRDGTGPDTWMPLVTIGEAGIDTDLRDLISFIDYSTTMGTRDPIALVLYGLDEPVEGATVVTLLSDGTFELPPWEVPLTANQLTEADAQDLVSLFAAAEQPDERAMPESEGDEPRQRVSDAAGALHSRLAEPRDGGIGESLLPDSDRDYLSNTATTTEDLATLAPRVSDEERARLLRLDPKLDDDLADWVSTSDVRPHLTVLGPIEVRARGDSNTDVNRRLAYYSEIVAYLAARERGATPEQVATAFNVQTNTIHSRVGAVRKWLGTHPETGEWYLPESTLSPAAKSRGIPVYQLIDVLSDADLFKRLRLRAQARGADGIGDLTRALTLVGGEPYSQQRPGGYGWLAETPVDQYLVAAIVDVAHIVSTRALNDGDTSLALWASEKAILAAPPEDKPRMDRHRALVASGRPQAAEAYLKEAVLNRSDDDAAPPAPSARTMDLLSRESIDRRAE